MKVLAWDTETSLIRQGCNSPPMSCLSYQFQGGKAHLLHWSEALEYLEGWLSDPEVLFVGHNVAFDFRVVCAEWPHLIPKVFAAYGDNRVTDTMLREKLIDIGMGRYRGFFTDEGEWVKLDYSLLAVAKRGPGIPIKKEGFRLFYGPLKHYTLRSWVTVAKDLQLRGAAWLNGEADEEFDLLERCFGERKRFRTEAQGMTTADPNEVITYPIDDARSTLAVYEYQTSWYEADYFVDEFNQARKYWGLSLTSNWGLRTKRDSVDELEREILSELQTIEQQLINKGLLRPDGSRDTKRAKECMLEACGWRWDEGYGKYVGIPERDHDYVPLRVTKAGEVALDADACKASGDATMQAYARAVSLKGKLTRDIPMLRAASVWPVHTHYDMAETARVTSSNPNVQNIKT